MHCVPPPSPLCYRFTSSSGIVRLSDGCVHELFDSYGPRRSVQNRGGLAAASRLIPGNPQLVAPSDVRRYHGTQAPTPSLWDLGVDHEKPHILINKPRGFMAESAKLNIPCLPN